MSQKNEDYMSYDEYLVRVKEGILTKDGHCPVTPLLEMLSGRWKSQLMYELCSMTDKKVNLAVISDINWDDEMSPWDCPPLSKNDIPCTGGADEYLVNLTGYISLLEIKRHEQEITCLARLKIKLKRLMSITKTAV
ncbi:MAG: hypothetical protein J6H31_04745 [Butyrivibrio sp.]|nr:hypothetical protein [Butyrivibrio sp.]